MSASCRLAGVPDAMQRSLSTCSAAVPAPHVILAFVAFLSNYLAPRRTRAGDQPRFLLSSRAAAFAARTASLSVGYEASDPATSRPSFSRIS